MLNAFKDFAVKGNAIDMAVGTVVAAALGKSQLHLRARADRRRETRSDPHCRPQFMRAVAAVPANRRRILGAMVDADEKRK